MLKKEIRDPSFELEADLVEKKLKRDPKSDLLLKNTINQPAYSMVSSNSIDKVEFDNEAFSVKTEGISMPEIMLKDETYGVSKIMHKTRNPPPKAKLGAVQETLDPKHVLIPKDAFDISRKSYLRVVELNRVFTEVK